MEHDAAVGVQLDDGECVKADWVISAADGHATVYELLGGGYAGKERNTIYRTLTPFPSYLQVSLGVARNPSQRCGLITRLLDDPLVVDPGTVLSQASFRIFHFDPTFAPPGKIAITCFLQTRNIGFWIRLQQTDPARYESEKRRVADAVIGVLEKSTASLRDAMEELDVSTPATDESTASRTETAHHSSTI